MLYYLVIGSLTWLSARRPTPGVSFQWTAGDSNPAGGIGSLSRPQAAARVTTAGDVITCIRRSGRDPDGCSASECQGIGATQLADIAWRAASPSEKCLMQQLCHRGRVRISRQKQRFGQQQQCPGKAIRRRGKSLDARGKSGRGCRARQPERSIHL